MSVSESFRKLADTQARLEETALQIKAERDEAITLLRETLLYSAAAENGAFKARVRGFLAKVSK